MPLRGIDYLESIPIWDGYRRFDLEQPRAILAKLGNPQNLVPAVHVAGTNGKGTVCALLASMFHASGRRVVQFCSPHLSDVTERCLLNGRPISRDIFEQAIDQTVAGAEAAGCTPSYFELVTAASFLAAKLVQAEIMIVETGLGGRLDATNTIAKPLASVITTIGLDHMNILGGTIEEIAAEKAGIIKFGAPVICGDLPVAAIKVIADKVDGCSGAGKLYVWGSDYQLIWEPKHQPPLMAALECLGTRIEFAGVMDRFRAGYQQHNVAVAAAAALVCGLPPEAVRQGILRTRWPGRVEQLTAAAAGRPVKVLLDVAHNRDGLSALLGYIESELTGVNRFVIIISILDRKEWQVMLALIREWSVSSKKNVRLVFTRSDDPRAVAPEELRAAYRDGEVIPDPYQAFERGAEIAAGNPDCMVVVTGSLFLVGKLRGRLTGEPFETISPH